MANSEYTSEGQQSKGLGETTVEVDELDPEAVSSEANQEAAAGAHTPVSYTIPTASTQDGGDGEGPVTNSVSGLAPSASQLKLALKLETKVSSKPLRAGTSRP